MCHRCSSAVSSPSMCHPLKHNAPTPSQSPARPRLRTANGRETIWQELIEIPWRIPHNALPITGRYGSFGGCRREKVSMKFETFKAGSWKQQYQYKSFQPTQMKREWSWDDPRINVLLEKATKALGELNAFSLIVPDVDWFIHMHIIKEANTSSRIEGTRTEIDEAVLEDEEIILPERRDDWREVQNYVQAMNHAIQELQTLPLSMRLLCKTHEIVLSGVRGERKTPGELRRSQNWIGGSSVADAAFVPPHQDELPELLTDLEAFWHNDQIHVPHLVRCALT